MFKDKRKVKVIALAIAAMFILGVASIALTQTGVTHTASAAPSSNIGIVNYQTLLGDDNAEVKKVNEAMQAEYQTLKQDFDAKTATMNDKEKQDYANQLQQRLMLKEQELKGALMDKVTAAVKSVAEAKGLSVVLEKGNVVYGGTDITDEVSKKLK